ncbi:MAG: NAD-dependent epimerase/dehydratase family protein, partial [Halobacteriaceae archaeon]
MPKSLVTGAGGFVGSHLVDALLEKDHTVHGLDNFQTGRRENIGHLSDDPKFELFEGDLRKEADVREAITGVDYVFHQGAVPSVPRSIDDPQLTTEANCTGTTNLLVAARDEDVESVVVASSSSVYGNEAKLPVTED